jgi:hypothetical protein
MDRTSGPPVDGAQGELVRVRVGVAGEHLAHHHAGESGEGVANVLDLEAEHGQAVGQGLGGAVVGGELAQPGKTQSMSFLRIVAGM